MSHLDKSLSKMLDIEHDNEDIEDQIAQKEKSIKESNTTTTKTSVNTTPNTEPTDQKFGLAEYVPPELQIKPLTDEVDVDDKALARASIRNVLTVTTDNLSGLLKLAQASEHPRAFEVAAVFAKTIIDAATKLDDLVEAKNKKVATTNSATPTNQYNQQNNIVMSSEEAMKMIRNMSKEGKSLLDNQQDS